jgi:hypothetical protein
MNNSILALVFLMAGTLLTTTAVTIVPAAYAEDDHKDKRGDDHKDKRGDDHDDDNGDGNKNLAEDESAAAIADCDDNEVEDSDYDCFGIAVNDIDVDIGGGNDLTGDMAGAATSAAATTTDIMTNPLFNAP